LWDSSNGTYKYLLNIIINRTGSSSASLSCTQLTPPELA
jgi:hypothetical protein